MYITSCSCFFLYSFYFYLYTYVFIDFSSDTRIGGCVFLRLDANHSIYPLNGAKQFFFFFTLPIYDNSLSVFYG